MKKHVLCVALAMLVLAFSVSAVMADCGSCGKPSCTSCAKPACTSCSTPCAPACNDYINAMGSKLYRGAVNVLTGWWEIPAQVCKGWSNGCGPCSPNFMGGIGGLFKGVWFAVGRTLSGAGDIAGFWAADPCDNCGIGYALDSEYSWSDCPAATCPACNQPKPCSCGACGTCPSLGCLEPIGNKLMRGLGNGLFGIAEVPGQICKGAKNGSCDMGIIKGLWYMLSRTIDGAIDVASFIFPNPTDTKGLKFDDKWPWTAMTENCSICGSCASPCAAPCAKPAPCAPCTK
jgi:putative exosortase-associated protein (TIGR04073 family)